MKQWFLVHVYSGQENKVATMIKEESKVRNLEDSIGEIYIPTRLLSKLKKNKRVKVEKKLYPGYIAVYMEPEREVLDMISKIRGVMSFVGKGREPQPLKEEEIKRLLGFKQKEEEGVSEIPFERGESVKIIDGPFTDFTGTVEEVYPDKERIKLMVTIFGRPTPVELNFFQVEPI
ncbi:MAG TPA: transcription termination/antitermination factor NusG [bacterium (Candidatus Stahlbacteria)]|nr:transcription termination/antitermination factor NusG [Candidatus Stahlbacteria bacterium]